MPTVFYNKPNDIQLGVVDAQTTHCNSLHTDMMGLLSRSGVKSVALGAPSAGGVLVHSVGSE